MNDPVREGFDVMTDHDNDVVRTRPERPATPDGVMERWGDGAVACFHADHGGWAWHHRNFRHAGPTLPYMVPLVPPTAAEVVHALDECRRQVMAMYGGNLDHPALDHIEAAMSAVQEVDSNFPSSAA